MGPRPDGPGLHLGRRPRPRRRPDLSPAGPVQQPGGRGRRPAPAVPARVDVQRPEHEPQSLQPRPDDEERPMITSAHRRGRERGSGLIVIIMIVAFMLAVGMLLLTVTGMSPKASDSMRLQGMAFDAAEAGFNAAWVVLNDNFLNRALDELRRPVPDELRRRAGPRRPDQPELFPQPDRRADRRRHRRRQHGRQPAPVQLRAAGHRPALLVHGLPHQRRSAGTITADDNDCILVCIGRGPRNTFKRLEIVIEVGS